MQPKVFRGKEVKMRIYGKMDSNLFRGVSNFKTLVGILLIKLGVVRATSLHKYFGTSIVNIIDLATLSK